MANLTEDQAQKLRVGLMGAAWREIMQPATQSRANNAIKALCLSVGERKTHGGEFKDANDDELRATIRECEWHLSVWSNELKVFDFNRAQTEQLRQQNGNEILGPLTGQPEGRT